VPECKPQLAFASAAKRVLNTIWDAFLAYGWVMMRRMFAMMTDWYEKYRKLAWYYLSPRYPEPMTRTQATIKAMREATKSVEYKKRRGIYAEEIPYGKLPGPLELIKLWRGIVDDFATAGRDIAKMLPMTTNEAIKKEMARSAREIAAIRLKYEQKLNEAAIAAGRPPRLPRPFAEIPPKMAEPRAIAIAGFVGLKEAWSQLALSLRPKEDYERQQVDLQKESNRDGKTTMQYLRDTRDGIEDLPERLAALQGGALRLTA